jgi:curli biogenesis system outer membrane secretion channel CsgG
MNSSRLGFFYKFGQLEEAKQNAPQMSLAAQEQVPTVPVSNIAIADLSGKNVSQADASIVSDFLRTELVSTGKCNVVEKANMDKVLAESAFQQSGCTTSECAVQIGKILNVRHMIVGSLSKLMDTYYITVNVVDVETSKIVSSYSQEASSAKELKAACKTLAQKLVNPENK